MHAGNSGMHFEYYYETQAETCLWKVDFVVKRSVDRRNLEADSWGVIFGHNKQEVVRDYTKWIMRGFINIFCIRCDSWNLLKSRRVSKMGKVTFMTEPRYGWTFSHSSTLALGPTQPSIQRLPGFFPGWGGERPGRGLNHPSPSSAEVKEKVKLYFYSLWVLITSAI